MAPCSAPRRNLTGPVAPTGSRPDRRVGRVAGYHDTIATALGATLVAPRQLHAWDTGVVSSRVPVTSTRVRPHSVSRVRGGLDGMPLWAKTQAGPPDRRTWPSLPPPWRRTPGWPSGPRRDACHRMSRQPRVTPEVRGPLVWAELRPSDPNTMRRRGMDVAVPVRLGPKAEATINSWVLG